MWKSITQGKREGQMHVTVSRLSLGSLLVARSNRHLVSKVFSALAQSRIHKALETKVACLVLQKLLMKRESHGFNKIKDFVVEIQINTAKQIKEKESQLKSLKTKFNNHLTNITQREAKLNEKTFQLRKREQELKDGIAKLAQERQNLVADNKRYLLSINHRNRSCQNTLKNSAQRGSEAPLPKKSVKRGRKGKKQSEMISVNLDLEDTLIQMQDHGDGNSDRGIQRCLSVDYSARMLNGDLLCLTNSMMAYRTTAALKNDPIQRVQSRTKNYQKQL